MNTKRFTLSMLIVTGLFSGSQLFSMSGLVQAQTEDKIQEYILKIEENANLFSVMYDNLANTIGTAKIKEMLNRIITAKDESVRNNAIDQAMKAIATDEKTSNVNALKNINLQDDNDNNKKTMLMSLLYYRLERAKQLYGDAKNLIAKLRNAGLKKIADAYNNQLVQVFTPFSVLTK